MALQWSRPLRQIKVVHALSVQQCNKLHLTWVQTYDIEIFSLAVRKGGAQCTAYLWTTTKQNKWLRKSAFQNVLKKSALR